MARFRAFLTDSESEAEETTQNATTATHPSEKPADITMVEDDSAEAGSESESSPPPPEHRKRTGKALVQPKDGRGYRAFKARRSQSPTNVLTSEEESVSDSEDDESPPPNQSQADPSLIPRAQQLGVEPQRMHVMQASLFGPGDGVEGVPTRHKALALSSSLSLSRKHSRDSDGEGLRQDSQQVRVCFGLLRNFSPCCISGHLSLTISNLSHTVPQENTPELTSPIRQSMAARVPLSTLVRPLAVPLGWGGDRVERLCI
jgi:nuclear pore complex protein Nup98-Nup96